jgi:hypothetical protein
MTRWLVTLDVGFWFLFYYGFGVLPERDFVAFLDCDAESFRLRNYHVRVGRGVLGFEGQEIRE